MKKVILILLLFVSFCLQAQIDNVIPAKPSPIRFVSDFAGVLAPEQEDALERKLAAYNDSTSSQIAIVTIHSTEGFPIEEVALQILRRWGVGNKEKDNGVVILAAIDDREVRIETGYGMEGVLPDVTAKSIIDNDIVPWFRQGNYYSGLDAATTSIFNAAAGEYTAPENYPAANDGSVRPVASEHLVPLVIFFLIVGFLIYAQYKGWIDMGSGGSDRGGSESWSGGSDRGSDFGGGSGGGGGSSGKW